MRLIVTTLILSGALVSGCASMTRQPGDRPMSYREEFAQLEATCEARGGILQPNGIATSGRPANDYVCDVRTGRSGRFD